jgi:CubicO group peptidase (beta-lactamase class C family)
MSARLSFFIAAVSFAASAFAADPLPTATPKSVGMSAERLARIGEVLQADIDKGRLPGAVIAVARRGKLVYFKAYGYLDKEAGTKMTTDAIFSIASMTKPMVAVGALELAERGLVQIDDPVSKYLPQFGKQQVAVLKAGDGGQGYDMVAALRQPTIMDLMRHTSGIIYGGRGATPVHKLYPAGSAAVGPGMTGQEVMDKLAGLPLLHQPGAVWDYGFGLDVLGMVIEKVSGQGLGQYLGAQLWKPLGMVDTGFGVPADKLKRYARGFANDPDTGKPQFVLDLSKPLKFECGGGCAASTAGDYLRFAQMLLNGGQLGGTRVLGRKTVEYMVSNQLSPTMVNLVGNADPASADMGFGLGVAVRTTPGIVRKPGSVGEFSWNGAYGTAWWADPKEQLAVVFMAQTPGPIRWHYRFLVGTMVNQALE